MPIDILYVGCLEGAQRGGSGVLGGQLVSGLAALGHRLRALAPRPSDADTAGDWFAQRHPGVSMTWFPVPVRSSDLLEGSRSPIYRTA
jgi:hypothetical protein